MFIDPIVSFIFAERLEAVEKALFFDLHSKMTRTKQMDSMMNLTALSRNQEISLAMFLAIPSKPSEGIHKISFQFLRG